MSWASVFCGTDALHGPLIPQYSPSSRTCLYFGLVPKAALSNRSKGDLLFDHLVGDGK